MAKISKEKTILECPNEIITSILLYLENVDDLQSMRYSSKRLYELCQDNYLILKLFNRLNLKVDFIKNNTKDTNTKDTNKLVELYNISIIHYRIIFRPKDFNNIKKHKLLLLAILNDHTIFIEFILQQGKIIIDYVNMIWIILNSPIDNLELILKYGKYREYDITETMSRVIKIYVIKSWSNDRVKYILDLLVQILENRRNQKLVVKNNVI